MAGIKEKPIGIEDNIHIVLRGSDGKIKDERKPNKDGSKRTRRKEYRTK